MVVYVSQGGTATHYVELYSSQNGSLVDDDRYVASGTLPVCAIVTPAGASGVTVQATATRISTGYYYAVITATASATLSSATTQWKLRYTVQIGGSSKSFEFEFVLQSAGAASEAGSGFSLVSDYRRSVAERFIVLPQQAISANGTVEIGDAATGAMEVVKNGVTLTATTDYVFTRPSTLKFVGAVLATDSIILRMAVGLEDEEIKKVASESKAHIYAALYPYFTVPFSGSIPDEVKRIERQMTRAKLILEVGPRPGLSFSKEEKKMAQEWLDAALEDLKAIIGGNARMLLPDGTAVAFKTGGDADVLWLDIQTDART